MRALLCFFALIFGGMSYILLIGYYSKSLKIKMISLDYITLGIFFVLWGMLFCGNVISGDIISGNVISGDIISGNVISGNMISGNITQSSKCCKALVDCLNTISEFTVEKISDWELLHCNFSFDLFLLFLILTIISWIDHNVQVIPNFLNLLIFLMGIFLSIAYPEQLSIWQRLLGMVIISLPLLIVNLFYPSGFGGGDIKFMAAVGYYLGAEKIFLGALIGSFMAAIICVGLLIFRKVQRKDKLAFGPYLCAGIMLAVLVG